MILQRPRGKRLGAYRRCCEHRDARSGHESDQLATRGHPVVSFLVRRRFCGQLLLARDATQRRLVRQCTPPEGRHASPCRREGPESLLFVGIAFRGSAMASADRLGAAAPPLMSFDAADERYPSACRIRRGGRCGSFREGGVARRGQRRAKVALSSVEICIAPIGAGQRLARRHRHYGKEPIRLCRQQDHDLLPH